MECIKYKGYTGNIITSMEDLILHGKILFIDDLVTYQSETPAGIKQAFEESVEDYIETCNEIGKPPEKPLSGTFNFRTTPEKHKALSIKALEKHDGIINRAMNEALEQYLCHEKEVNVNINHKHEHIISQSINLDQDFKKEPEWQLKRNEFKVVK
ncbi:MAG: toxin-antitoxin system HicB family antitoxin [Gammaproteobacteria bacterium]|nr:MAG: toxin-antitoxin system HicB family antitoxin [Gammaproteobacteria bacterium]